MGRDKASLRLPHPAGGTAQTLAERSAALLSEVCSLAIEVGPGHSPLPHIEEIPPRSGPLAAIAAGWRELGRAGWQGPVLVVATDLPRLTVAMLRWLVEQPGAGSVVPVAGGRAQPLCARYAAADVGQAASLVAQGERAMSALLAASRPRRAAEREWAEAAGGAVVLADVDTPEALGQLRL